jgi:hypothetical protein
MLIFELTQEIETALTGVQDGKAESQSSNVCGHNKYEVGLLLSECKDGSGEIKYSTKREDATVTIVTSWPGGDVGVSPGLKSAPRRLFCAGQTTLERRAGLA